MMQNIFACRFFPGFTVYKYISLFRHYISLYKVFSIICYSDSFFYVAIALHIHYFLKTRWNIYVFTAFRIQTAYIYYIAFLSFLIAVLNFEGKLS